MLILYCVERYGDQRDIHVLTHSVPTRGSSYLFDERLRGRAGHSQIEVNAYGRAMRGLERTDGQPGDDVVLTIDDELQRYAIDRLSGESAAADRKSTRLNSRH